MTTQRVVRPGQCVVIYPQPDWIRPASGGTDTWHGYCGSGPQEGLVCPFGVNGRPEKIDGVWYWVQLWACPYCEGEEVKSRGSKVWCAMCGRSNDDSVCQCGSPSVFNDKTKNFCGCCDNCMPF